MVFCGWLLAGWLAVGLAPARAAELIMFESPGCPWCKIWHTEIGPGYPRSSEGHRAPLRVHALSRASQAGVVLASPVTASPTFVLADGGKEVGRIVGYPGADFFWPLLDELITKLEPASHGGLAGTTKLASPALAGLRRFASVRRF